MKKVCAFLALSAFLVACAPPVLKEVPNSSIESENNIATPRATGAIPRPVQRTLTLPKPRASKKTGTYDLAVSQVKLHDLLFAIARNAKLNVDIPSDLSGEVTINAIDQTLQQILARIGHQVGARLEIVGDDLIIVTDTPFLRTYEIDYIDMSLGVARAPLRRGRKGRKDEATRSENGARKLFWETMTRNVADLVLDTDTPLASTARSRAAASVVAHPESGVLAVRATARGHEKIRDFLSRVMQSAKRQVLIEALVAEVRLSSDHPHGIDWSRLPLDSAGFTLAQREQRDSGHTPPSGGVFKPRDSSGGIASALKLLEGFGKVKVLSRPKLAVMNKQSAVVKIIDDKVYFTLNTDTMQSESLPVGFVMRVTPQIGEDDSVVLSVRPSVSVVVSQIPDPNPALANPCGVGVAGCGIPPIVSKLPVVRTREMESVLRVDDGRIAVLGGLIEDRIESSDDAPPAASNVPVFGELFRQRDEIAAKIELVVFLQPRVVKDARAVDDSFRDAQSPPESPEDSDRLKGEGAR
ncbi:MAG: type II and III secretion system protein [Candidatus Accumulibacter sp.]|nr:type II and III secretion system protein [Accumulibacter sp.]